MRMPVDHTRKPSIFKTYWIRAIHLIAFFIGIIHNLWYIPALKEVAHYYEPEIVWSKRLIL